MLKKLILCIIISFISFFSFYSTIAYAKQVDPSRLSQTVLDMLKNIITDNEAFVAKHDRIYFEKFYHSQSPRSVILSCSDSRFHMHAVDATPDNDIFLIRNIGNQVKNNLGSIEYGIRHLHAPLLVIIGHSNCGAVKAVTEKKAGLEQSIQRELENIQVPIKKPSPSNEELLSNIETNIDNQVKYAMSYFTNEVKSGKLLVIGALYDFKNQKDKNNGRLIIKNINGQKDKGLIDRIIKIALEKGVYH